MLGCRKLASIGETLDPTPHSSPSPASLVSRWTSKLVATVDAGTERMGGLLPWLLLILVLVGAFNALARYGGKSIGVDLSSNLYIELQWYLFSAVFLLGGAYTLKKGAHVRVDVVSSRLSDRTRFWIERLGLWLLLIPYCVFMIYISWSPVAESISLAEQSPDPGGLPRYYVKALIPLGFVILFLQGLAEGLRPRAVADLHQGKVGDE